MPPNDNKSKIIYGKNAEDHPLQEYGKNRARLIRLGRRV
jgi:hypothetical protein